MNKFTMSAVVNQVTPAHVYVSIFTGMIPADGDHEQAVRGLAGELTLRVDELGPFLQHIRPHVVRLRVSVPPALVRKYTGVSIDPEFPRRETHAEAPADQ